MDLPPLSPGCLGKHGFHRGAHCVKVGFLLCVFYLLDGIRPEKSIQYGAVDKVTQQPSLYSKKIRLSGHRPGGHREVPAGGVPVRHPVGEADRAAYPDRHRPALVPGPRPGAGSQHRLAAAPAVSEMDTASVAFSAYVGDDTANINPQSMISFFLCFKCFLLPFLCPNRTQNNLHSSVCFFLLTAYT